MFVKILSCEFIELSVNMIQTNEEIKKTDDTFLTYG